MEDLFELLYQAQLRRAELLAELEGEQTDCWRLFHGVSEGLNGLTIDRYGPIILAQTFRGPLTPFEIDALKERYGPGFVYNHRGSKRVSFTLHRLGPDDISEGICQEFGLKYSIKARHRGLDPHLFLDLRSGRRWLLQHSQGKSVLNLFAYSCSLGQVALSAGAQEVWNVDFSDSALEIGRVNLKLNSLPGERVRFLKEDVFPVLWQLTGLGVKGKRARRPFEKVEPRSFDLVLLDPPAKAQGPFQTVDLVNDYQSLFKPALLVCAEGGTVLATNNVGSVDRQSFAEQLLRCAEKAGRPLKSLEWLLPDADFPSFDGQHPLKVAICSL